MKHPTFSKSGFAVTALFLAVTAVACASSDEVPDTAGSKSDTDPPPTTLPPTTTQTKPPEKKCATSCKTDLDCANTCPALAGGVQCCDLKTKTCWGSKTTACPKPDETTEPPPLY